MMNPAVRWQHAREAAQYAEQNGYRPTVVSAAMKAEAQQVWAAGGKPSIRIPFIGDYVPEGFTPTDRVLFVDTSGFGGREESALTTEEFLAALTPGYAYAMTEAGQFQAYIQEYEVGEGV